MCIALLEPRPGPVDGYGNSPTGGARGSPSQVSAQSSVTSRQRLYCRSSQTVTSATVSLLKQRVHPAPDTVCWQHSCALHACHEPKHPHRHRLRGHVIWPLWLCEGCAAWHWVKG